MRFPVFARSSDLKHARPIVRKSKTYVEAQVNAGRADWVDHSDPTRGIVCRELLHLGLRQFQPEPVQINCTSFGFELPGVIFIPPSSQPDRDFRSMVWRWEQSERQLAALAG